MRARDSWKKSKKLWGALLLCFGLAACSRPREIGAWVTYWRFQPGVDSVTKASSPYRDVFLFAGTLDALGNPQVTNLPSGSSELVRGLRARGIRVWLTMVNDSHATGRSITLKNPDLIHEMLSSRERRARHIEQLLTLTRTLGADGLDIDYENLLFADRAAFSAFVRELVSAAKERNVATSVTVQPKSTEKSSDGAGAVDWGTLCNVPDRFQIMLYNLHTDRTKPGPISTSTWNSSVIQFALDQGCSARNLVAVLKISGMNWGPTKAASITFDDAETLTSRNGAQLYRELDSQGATPYFTYRTEEGSFTGYFEDVRSIGVKIAALEELGVSRVVLWSLGNHDLRIDELSAPAKK